MIEKIKWIGIIFLIAGTVASTHMFKGPPLFRWWFFLFPLGAGGLLILLSNILQKRDNKNKEEEND